MDVQIFETAQGNPRMWVCLTDRPSPEVKMLWEAQVEGTVPPARQPDAPTGSWGEPSNGLRSRLLLDRKQCQSEQPVWVWLDVRNESREAKKVARAHLLQRFLHVIHPDGQRAKLIEDVWEKDIFVSEIAPGEERSMLILRTSDNYRLTKPGRYRVEWPAINLAALKDVKWHGGDRAEILAPPSAPPVTFEVVPATAE